jgi:hypothetical protein
MNNEKIVRQIIKKFGLEKSIEFLEIASFMFEQMSKQAIANGLSSGECDDFDYGYDSIWYKSKHEDLKSKLLIK